jgi:4-diphosphocytidyl-2-C-methyl-D-erythritol kinase
VADLTDNAATLLPVRPRVQSMGEGRLRSWAPAKINLDLLVGPLQEDGYHPLDSLVAAVSLYDCIDLTGRDDGRIELTCTGPDCGPADKNLALRAAQIVRDRCGDQGGVSIELTKAIPPGKGLGGGSSDAAAVLIGLNELWQLDLDTAALCEAALALGSDVPLFLGPPALRMTGRGEVVEPATIALFTAVLILPDLACATPAVYSAYDAAPSPIGQHPAAELLATHPPSQWRHDLANDLAGPARTVNPALAALWDGLAGRIAQPIHLTGSGSGLFVLCDDLAEADGVRTALGEPTGTQILLVQPAE